MSEFKFKVPCDIMFNDPRGARVVDGKLSGDDIDEEVGVYFAGDDGFPQRELCVDKTISFEFDMSDPVGMWCFAKDIDSAKALCDWIAYELGEVPSDLYDRIIYEV